MCHFDVVVKFNHISLFQFHHRWPKTQLTSQNNNSAPFSHSIDTIRKDQSQTNKNPHMHKKNRKAHELVPISSPLTHMVYLLSVFFFELSSELIFRSICPSARPTQIRCQIPLKKLVLCQMTKTRCINDNKNSIKLLGICPQLSQHYGNSHVKRNHSFTCHPTEAPFLP